jgi:hypothetical protein
VPDVSITYDMDWVLRVGSPNIYVTVKTIETAVVNDRKYANSSSMFSILNLNDRIFEVHRT